MTATGLVCSSCGIELPENAKFCLECGAAVSTAAKPAEYKQVTVLFADVVHSMEIAAAVGVERLREIMADLADRCAAVVKRYGGTVDKFTGDGIMAVFGAPVALEDHAFRACLAALSIQAEAAKLAEEVQARDGIDLQLRVGLNSGQVIAGEIGSGSFGYTAVGEQVGMAQRIESVAPPGGVMLSASTARLVEGAAALAEPEMVHIKGANEPVTVYQLLSIGDRQRTERVESNLVGRRWEMAAVEGMLQRAIDGHGAVVGVVGPPGIGKSRLVREVVAIAGRRGVEVFTTFCESHTKQIPFHAVARLLRATTGVEGLDARAARAHIRDRNRDADPEDLLLFDDLLGIADPDIALPKIDPDARGRRLTALVNTAALARENPAVYVIEDAHWIDEVSESLIADFLTVIPQTPSLVLITYRPEYRGALSQVADAQAIVLAPLRDSETAALVSELFGPDPSVRGLGQTIADRAAGNPFFAEEMVRDLVERGVLQGQPGGYVSTVDGAEVSVPATLQATIAARIDRLEPKAKRTLSAAAVVGSRFGLEMLTLLGVEPAVADLVAAQLIDQVRFTRQPEYVFHHPLIRTVGYEAQLKSDRVELHRRLAAAIEAREPELADQNAALIAEHLEAAGDLHAAFDWRMRAGTWATSRDVIAARASWQRARQVADRMPADDPDLMTMRIAPRTLLCTSAWRAEGSGAETGFAELRDLCAAAGDKKSLAIGMAGLLMSLTLNSRHRESSRLASEFAELLESIGDPAMTIGLLYTAATAKYEAGEMIQSLRLAQRVIDLADGDPAAGNLILGSPLAVALGMRGFTRAALGIAGWRQDLDDAVAMANTFDPASRVLTVMYKYLAGITIGAVLADPVAARDTAEMLQIGEQAGDFIVMMMAQLIRGIAVVRGNGPDREAGFDLLPEVREAAQQGRLTVTAVPLIDIEIAQEKACTGDVDGAIELAGQVIDDMHTSGEMVWHGRAIAVLVESLLDRGADGDLEAAAAAIDRLAAVPVDPGFVLHELPLLRLRALVARARGDDTAYRDFRDRYRDMAKTLGFEGHMAWAETMP
jgi:class 3 adenylate cyclase